MSRKTPVERPPRASSECNSLAASGDDFDAVVRLIAAARPRTFQAVNLALIDLHWQIGALISRKIEPFRNGAPMTAASGS